MAHDSRAPAALLRDHTGTPMLSVCLPVCRSPSAVLPLERSDKPHGRPLAVGRLIHGGEMALTANKKMPHAQYTRHLLGTCLLRPGASLCPGLRGWEAVRCRDVVQPEEEAMRSGLWPGSSARTTRKARGFDATNGRPRHHHSRKPSMRMRRRRKKQNNCCRCSVM